MSKHDDPRWYEEQPNEQNQPSFLEQPAHISSDDVDHDPSLPAPENPPEQQSQTTEATPSQEPPRRFQRILGQALLTLALVILAFWGGWFAHQYLGQTFDPSNPSRSYSQMIQQAWTDIDQHYVDRKAVDYKKMSYAAINAMVQTLGDTGHSRFMDQQTVESENRQLSGNDKSTGIGVILYQDPTTKQLTLIETIPDSPAERAGLKPGDIIKSINGTDVTGKDLDTARGLIRGPIGRNDTLVIQRPGETETRTFTITLAEFQVPNVVMHYITESHIAHIQVVQFDSGVTDQVRDDINQAKSMGATKIILDLRNNPGGYLNEAINMSSLFLKKGNVLIEQDSTGQRTIVPANGSPIDTTTQMVILVNRDTGSAAEIVTGALKENHRATIIGQTTFGTGTLLTQFTLGDGSALYLGTQEWLTPDGHFIRQVANDPNSGGIKPNIQVDGNANATLNPVVENESNLSQQQILDSGDAQLAAAIQFLNK